MSQSTLATLCANRLGGRTTNVSSRGINFKSLSLMSTMSTEEPSMWMPSAATLGNSPQGTHRECRTPDKSVNCRATSFTSFFCIVLVTSETFILILLTAPHSISALCAPPYVLLRWQAQGKALDRTQSFVEVPRTKGDGCTRQRSSK